jgi:hypothetical protein
LTVKEKIITFKIQAPWKADSSEDIEIKLPYDPNVIRGRNIMIAVINSDQKGEQILEYYKEFNIPTKTLFLSDIGNIMIASTTQAMATTKTFGVTERSNKKKLDV